MDERLDFPGLANTWTMRVENRLDMKLTGIKNDSWSEGAGDECGRNPTASLTDPGRPF